MRSFCTEFVQRVGLRYSLRNGIRARTAQRIMDLFIVEFSKMILFTE